MRLMGIGKRKRRGEKEDRMRNGLFLEVHLVGTKKIELFQRFQCCPTCFVTTNTFFVKRSSRLKNSNTRWNQIVKLKLPARPVSPYVDLVVYDCISSKHSHGVNDESDFNSGSEVENKRKRGYSSSSTLTPYSRTNLSVSGESISDASIYGNSTAEGTRSNVTSKNLPYLTIENNKSSTTAHRHSRSFGNLSLQRLSIPSPSVSSSPSGYSPSGQKRNFTSDSNNQGSLGTRNKSSYLYVGETRVSLTDIFKVKDTATGYNFFQPPQWFPLYDKKRQKSDDSGKEQIIGEIQVGFRLKCNNRSHSIVQEFNEWNKYLHENKKSNLDLRNVYSSSAYLDDENEDLLSMKDPDARDLCDEFIEENINLDEEQVVMDEDDDDELEDDVLAIPNELIEPLGLLHLSSNNSDDSTSPDASGKNDSDPSNDAFDELENGYEDDVESFSDELKDIDYFPDEPLISENLENSSILTIPTMVTALDEYEVVLPSSDEVMTLDDVIASRNSSPDTPTDGLSRIKSGSPHIRSTGSFKDDRNEESENSSDLNSTILKMNRKKLFPMLKRKRTRANYSSFSNYYETLLSRKFQLSKREHALGVMFVHFESIEGLPELKNKISKTYYAMDPFIIMTFGRRVFKTSWRKHTLNPVFDERAAFEIYPNEKHYDIHLSVMDKDSFSYNDMIAKYELTLQEVMQKQTPDHDWKVIEIPLKLTLRDSENFDSPVLRLGIRYVPYSHLKSYFWKRAVSLSTDRETFDLVQTLLFLQRLGSFSEFDVLEFFSYYKKLPWSGETLTQDELVNGLQQWTKSGDFKNIWKCPSCFRSFRPSNNDMNSKLILENDLITHFALCSFKKCGKVLKPSYVSSQFASKRWFSKLLIKLTYGKYAVGSNNANILVQDRDTGIVLEEKISAHVKVGMRIIYNGKGKESKKFKTLLKTLSVRQGKKFDNPLSAKQIDSFIKFHDLDMSQCEPTEYRTFNEFFYRKLKPGSRPPEGDTSEVMVSAADSRCTVYSTIQKSKEIWIKGSKFSLNRLTGGYRPEIFNDSSCSIAIFRLAPQDYHRIHCPVDGVVGKPIFIKGEYYTVNPMAVRSELDVFGENVRVIVPIETKEFGPLLYIAVGAMMVGSIILTCQEGDFKRRGDEMGYFKFGGSTVILVMQSKKLIFDSDLVSNSLEGIETLVKVGMSIGHTLNIKEIKRRKVKPTDEKQIEKIKRSISVAEHKAENAGNIPWQMQLLEKDIREGNLWGTDT